MNTQLKSNIERPILGGNFLCHFNLLINMTHFHLVDALTPVHIQGITSMAIYILPLFPTNKFEALLSDFPLLAQSQPQFAMIPPVSLAYNTLSIILLGAIN